ncbi:hypothetical protein PV328_006118 [Microctonus aethiopoides]|uniref:Uncharacterized protein n=1 Tax=Microctonus aethiopoides TaxID=144406 RepID=A0AA39FNT1_9HYME|nr:hypothetical protein PV328_006118 [Microctonus aethiopoides]
MLKPLNTASDSSLNPLPPSNVSLANEATVSDSNAASETSDEDDDISECDYNGVLWGLIPHLSLTENLVQLMEHLAKSLRKAYDKEKLKNSNLPASQVAAEYFGAKDTKKEISPGCGFYLSKITAQRMEMEAAAPGRGWRHLVRECLLYVYGDSLANYSATGKRSHYPQINQKLYRGLYEWANVLNAPDNVALLEFNDSIQVLKTRFVRSNKGVKDELK